MPYEIMKNQDVGTNYKVGDILVGSTHMYRTKPYWYQVVKVTKKQLTLKRMQESYSTKYMDNTPGDYCMPVFKIGNEHILTLGYPYWIGPRDTELVIANVERYKWEGEEEWSTYAKRRGDRYAPLLSLWDGKPQWVNCD